MSSNGTYLQLGQEIGALVDEKNKAYGSSFDRAGSILRELYPSGVNPEQYDDLLAIARVIDKLFRIATDKGAFGESPWSDIAGYVLLGARRHSIEKQQQEMKHG